MTEDTPATTDTSVTPTLAPDVVTVHAAYVVVINRDGSISTTAVTPAGLKPITVERVATTSDVFESSKDIVTDLESQMLADRVARRVLDMLTPTDESTEAKNRIAQALADRKAE
jgi:hypothetical protein